MSIQSQIILKPLMDYPRVVLEPIVDNVKKIYNFGQMFYDYVIVDVTIFNTDATNSLKYKLNKTKSLTLPASSMISYNNIIIWEIEIETDGVSYEIQLFGIPRVLIEKR